MLWQLSFFFLSLTAPVARGAPSCYSGDCAPSSSPGLPQQKRQMQSLEVFITETQMVVFSDTQTETTTEVITTTELASSVDGASTSTSLSSQSAATIRPEVQFVGEVPDPAPDAATVLFLPITNPLSLLSSVLPATASTELTSSFTTDSATTSTSSEAATPSPPATTSDSSSDAISTSDDPSPTLALPSPSDSDSPSETDTTSTETDSAVDPSASPAFALQQPTVKGPLVSAYYPDWVSSTLPPEKIDMTRFDWIDFAFVTPDQAFNLAFDDPSTSPAILKRVVAAAHAKTTKVKVSIGGWGGSKYFSPACATSSSRQTFVKNIVALYKQYNLDGIDIDWEYPGLQGEGSNVVSPQDSANFLAMLKLLRTSLPSTARITAATQDVPFADASGRPMKDVSAFAAVLDWINIMNYDIFQSSSTPGPNSPLSDGCRNSTQPGLNAASAISAWAAAKFPASRLMLGVPAYGYINPSRSTHLVTKRSSVMMSEPHTDTDTQTRTRTRTFRRDADAQSPAAIVTVKSEDGTTNSGQVQFADLVAQGALINTTSAGLVGYGGFTRFFDTCSSTPFLTSPYTNQVITYDDPQSLKQKAQFAMQSQILGTAMWDLSGDTTQWDLTNALRQGLGKS